MRPAIILAFLLIGSVSSHTEASQPVQWGNASVQTTWDSQTVSNVTARQMTSSGLMIMGILGAFVSSVYFIVRAFSVSATWGVFMLLFNGITIPLFCLFQFERARRPLGILLFSIAAIVGGAYVSNGA